MREKRRKYPGTSAGRGDPDGFEGKSLASPGEALSLPKRRNALRSAQTEPGKEQIIRNRRRPIEAKRRISQKGVGENRDMRKRRSMA